MEDEKLKKELDKIPDTDENGEPIYKIRSELPTDKLPEMPDDLSDKSEFKDTLQDLKDDTSQE